MAMGPRFDFILYKREGVPSRQLNKIRMGSKPTFGALICLKFYNNFCPGAVWQNTISNLECVDPKASNDDVSIFELAHSSRFCSKTGIELPVFLLNCGEMKIVTLWTQKLDIQRERFLLSQNLSIFFSYGPLNEIKKTALISRSKILFFFVVKKKSTFVAILRLSDMAMGPRFDFILYKREGVPSRKLNKMQGLEAHFWCFDLPEVL